MAAEDTARRPVGEVSVITGVPRRPAPALSFPEVGVDLLVGDAYNEIPA
jgi:hypothetical protein